VHGSNHRCRCACVFDGNRCWIREQLNLGTKVSLPKVKEYFTCGSVPYSPVAVWLHFMDFYCDVVFDVALGMCLVMLWDSTCMAKGEREFVYSYVVVSRSFLQLYGSNHKRTQGLRRQGKRRRNPVGADFGHDSNSKIRHTCKMLREGAYRCVNGG
jgi:hypothetical protein